jgi:hypothetical protein
MRESCKADEVVIGVRQRIVAAHVGVGNCCIGRWVGMRIAVTEDTWVG